MEKFSTEPRTLFVREIIAEALRLTAPVLLLAAAIVGVAVIAGAGR